MKELSSKNEWLTMKQLGATRKIKMKYIFSTVLLICSMWLIRFYVFGCIVNLLEQLKFAFGSFIYISSLILLIDFHNLTIKKLISYLPVFLLLNIVAYYITYLMNYVFILYFS